LPPGEITIDLWRGPEYQPVRRTVNLAPGQISLRVAIERLVDLRTRGWYSGDTRVTEVSPHTALLEAACEDVAVVNLLARAGPEAMPSSNLIAFSGQKPALERPGHLVAVNTLNSNPLLGTVGLLNCHRPVFPLRTGDQGLDDWTLADWCDQCHRKDTGLVIWSDPRDTPGQAPKSRLWSEALADFALGKIDAYEITGFDAAEPEVLADWYRLLQAGYRLPLVGGSAKDGGGAAVGRVRTYAWLGPIRELDYSGWIEAVRGGRTFVTNGPLVNLSVGAFGPGGVVDVEPGQHLPIRVEARSGLPFERLELLVNGSLVAAKEASGTRLSAQIDTEWPVDQSCWVAARCISGERLPDGQVIFGHSSPVWVNVREAPFRPAAGVVESLLAELERFLDWVRNQAPRAAGARPDRLAEVLTAARSALAARINQDGR
jgi:hypothetical protein